MENQEVQKSPKSKTIGPLGTFKKLETWWGSSKSQKSSGETGTENEHEELVEVVKRNAKSWRM
jgi:hypothetical protein